MKKLLFVVILLALVVFVICKRVYWENSANAMRRKIGKVEELRVFDLPSNKEDAWFVTQDADIINELLDAIEFEKTSLIKLFCIKSPGVMEFITIGVTTQKLQWIEFGSGYLRADNGLLSGDVQLTEKSSKQLTLWLKLARD